MGSITLNSPTIAGQGTNTGTIAGGLYGTATWQGGTINNPVMGTPAITGGTYNNGVFGTPSMNGGTATNLKLVTPTFSPSISPVYFGTIIATNGTTASTSYVPLVGGTLIVTPNVTSNVQLFFNGEWYNGGQHFNYMEFLKNGTVLVQISQYQPSAAAQNIINLNYVDSSVGTAGGTYSVQFKVDNGTATIVGGSAGAENSRFYALAFPV